MKKYFCISLLLTLFVTARMQGQSEGFIVKPAPFSSRAYDEFSPVFYKGGIVFCTNQNYSSLVAYKADQERLFKIFYVAKKDTLRWKSPKLFSGELTSAFNDGPVTFNNNGNIVYYSRNNSIENILRNISDTSNKLGIYSAELINGIWTNIKPFTHNNQLYSFSTPALTPEGDRIYFSSDIPGGSGGTDLYYCDWRSNDWDQPVNLGPVINTPKNESFPFAGKYGKLYFASDGHEGFGGKDLFYTQEIGGKWIVPVQLDSTINSPADEFGFMTDSLFKDGFFSSNRLKTDDIFSFNTPPVEFTECDTIRENNYCFTLYDEQHRLIDSIQALYKWDFGEGIIRTGKEVKHCFPGPGEYMVELCIIDELTGDTIANKVDYKVELENIGQAYINSYNIGIVNKSILFDGAKIELKEFNTTDYFWNFGDGFKTGGPLMNKSFNKKGEYMVKMGLIGEKDSLGIIPKRCFMKKIRIYNGFQDLALKGESEEDRVNEVTDSVPEQIKTLQIRIFLMDDLAGRQKTKISEALMGSWNTDVKFDNSGILLSSYPFLDIVAGILKGNPDLRLEIAVQTFENVVTGETMKISERWAGELAFYFKNKEINIDAIGSKGFDADHKLLKQYVPDGKLINGVIDFIFIDNSNEF